MSAEKADLEEFDAEVVLADGDLDDIKEMVVGYSIAAIPEDQRTNDEVIALDYLEKKHGVVFAEQRFDDDD